MARADSSGEFDELEWSLQTKPSLPISFLRLLSFTALLLLSLRPFSSVLSTSLLTWTCSLLRSLPFFLPFSRVDPPYDSLLLRTSLPRNIHCFIALRVPAGPCFRLRASERASFPSGVLWSLALIFAIRQPSTTKYTSLAARDER